MKIGSKLILVTTLIAATTLFGMSCSNNSTGSGGDDRNLYSHIENPGASANDFLSGENFTSLEVEIDYMQGFEPNAEALDSLKAFLEQRLNKQSVTINNPTEIPAVGQASYTANEVRDLEEEHRDEYTEGNTLKAYMIIVDGEYEDGNVLGIAYFNTSNAFFGATYDEVSGGLNQPSRRLTESISFRHEFGHLFGLVNIPGSGTEMQTNHQDTEHGRHCDNDSCLMYYAMENAGVFGQFFEGEIAPLDANCLADLQANGGK
jgi:predicted Zn-dependent protease